MSAREVQRYYESSDDELGQRYIKDEPFLSAEYCKAALDHRYQLYPFIPEFLDSSRWAGKQVLEIGCGHGADLSQFALAGARTFACDLTLKHCRISRQFVGTLGANASIVQASAERLPFPTASFDLVYSFGVLLLVDDLRMATAEIRRVLKPGGSVVTMFYNRHSLHYYLKTLYYYGVVCDLDRLLGPRRLVDWFTDGFGYPRVYHHTQESLRSAFDEFTIDRLVVRNLTKDQLPGVSLDAYPEAFRTWLETCAGFYLMLEAHR